MIAIHNETPGDDHVPGSHRLSSKQAAELFFKIPIVLEFPNPIYYTRERWLLRNASISDNPLPSDPGYDAHIVNLNEILDRKSKNGLLYENLVTKVYIERIE